MLNADLLKAGKFGLATAFIGGGCCVHLSIEYAPSGAADGLVGVLVQDSQDTTLAWVKKVHAGLGVPDQGRDHHHEAGRALDGAGGRRHRASPLVRGLQLLRKEG